MVGFETGQWKITNGNTDGDCTPIENAHLVDFGWTENEQARLKPLVVRYILRGASGAWRVHRLRLAC